MSTVQDYIAFSQGKVEAFVKAGQIYVQGVQDISKQVVVFAQNQINDNVASLKAIVGAKSIREAIELQTGAARSNVEKVFAEVARVNEASVKLVEQAFAPIAARVQAANQAFSLAA